MTEQFGNNNRGYQSVGDRFDQQETGYSGQGYNNNAPGYGDQRSYNARMHTSLSSSTRTHYLPSTGEQDVEMNQYNDSSRPVVNILDQCTQVNEAIDELDRKLDDLDRVFRQSLARPDMPSGEIDRLSADIMTVYRSLVERVKKIKGRSEAGSSMNASQVARTDRRLKATIQKYQTLESGFRKESQQAAERQYRIVRPDATDAEVREAVSDPNAPIFQQAVSRPHM
jgi:syntaxin 1B/2/3